MLLPPVAAWVAATSTIDGKLGSFYSPLTTKHQLWGHLPPFFCANTPEEMCETLPHLCETKSRGAAASGLTDCCGETLCETLFIVLPICANTGGGTDWQGVLTRFAYICIAEQAIQLWQTNEWKGFQPTVM